jgi:hypothetical protein
MAFLKANRKVQIASDCSHDDGNNIGDKVGPSKANNIVVEVGHSDSDKIWWA